MRIGGAGVLFRIGVILSGSKGRLRHLRRDFPRSNFYHHSTTPTKPSYLPDLAHTKSAYRLHPRPHLQLIQHFEPSVPNINLPPRLARHILVCSFTRRQLANRTSTRLSLAVPPNPGSNNRNPGRAKCSPSSGVRGTGESEKGKGWL